MSSTKSTKLPPNMTAPWTEPAPLADVPGGERNLLHRSAWSDPDNPLKVMLKPWYDGDDPSGGPWKERVDVFLDDDESDIIGCREWDLPMDPDDYYVPISADRLPSGRHTLSFIMTNFVSTPDRSHPFPVTVDKSPPDLAFASELLIDPDIIQNGLSEQYLNEHNGIITVSVPTYVEPAPGDRITARWLNEYTGQSEEVTKDLDRDNYENPIWLDFTEALIRRMGDGTRSISYHVADRAGNESVESTAVPFLVSVIRAPHYVPHPWITQAEGSPAEYADLNPSNVVAGATAKIPDDAVYYDDDIVHMQFGEPGTVGAIAVPVPWGTKEVRIPPGNIAAMFGKGVPVYYDVVLADTSNKPSRTLTVAIGTFPTTRFHVPQLVSPFTDPVSKASITNSGVPVHQRAWAFISEACLVTITVSGKNLQDQTVSRIVLDQHRVQLAEVTAGIPVNLPKDFMMSLLSNRRFTVETKVSFDDGARWTAFDHLTPMLID
ncbi:hypothetical protein [Pseudomonas sp. RL_5y_Pfl2_73]|uniref:hypothetical protein n=1 Tax=Pseudomonas sp. RL_5y_Pfl2_73 TaxID=3088713 RepID=UPI0030DCC268